MPQRVNERMLKDLGGRIAVYRRVRALSREQLAEAAGVGVSSLQRLENGQSGVSVGILVSVLSALGLQDSLNQMAFVPDDLLPRPAKRPTKAQKR